MACPWPKSVKNQGAACEASYLDTVTLAHPNRDCHAQVVGSMRCMYTMRTCDCLRRLLLSLPKGAQFSGFVKSIIRTHDPPQVRVRCVGEQGSGHGAYSEAVIFTTPGSRESVSKAASVRSEASSSTAGDAGRALTLASSGKGRKGGTNPAEADGLLPGQAGGHKAKNSARKAPGTSKKVAFIWHPPSDLSEV